MYVSDFSFTFNIFELFSHKYFKGKSQCMFNVIFSFRQLVNIKKKTSILLIIRKQCSHKIIHCMH